MVKTSDFAIAEGNKKCSCLKAAKQHVPMQENKYCHLAMNLMDYSFLAIKA